MGIQDTSGQDRVLERRGLKKSAKVMIGLGVIFLIGSALLFPAFKRWSRAERSFERSRLRYDTVVRGDLIRDLHVEGKIVASFYPTLYSPAQGTVTLSVRGGERVAEDQVLATVASPELSSRFQQELSSLAALEAELSSRRINAKTTNLENQQDVDLKKLRLETASREMARAEKSFSEGLITRVDYDKAMDDVSIAELEHRHAVESTGLQVETLTLEIRNMEKQLERQQLILDESKRQVDALRITSPVAGVVGNIMIDPKDIVTQNQALMTVIDLSTFEIQINIPENYADEIEAGAAAEISYEGQPYNGLVLSVSPQVTNSMVEGRVAFQGELPQGLKQNQRVSTRLILTSKQDVLKVRRGPFVESGGGRKVYVVRDDLAVLESFTIGATSLTEVEITKGLLEGEVIVISDTSRFEGAEAVLLRK